MASASASGSETGVEVGERVLAAFAEQQLALGRGVGRADVR